jgi:hypothetical protein
LRGASLGAVDDLRLFALLREPSIDGIEEAAEVVDLRWRSCRIDQPLLNAGGAQYALERPRKPAPEGVLMAWAREWAKEGVAVDRRELLPPEGFLALPRRCGWLSIRVVVDRPAKEDEPVETTRGCVRAARRSCTLP